MRDYLTYGDEKLEGLHADLEIRLRKDQQELIDQGYSIRRQRMDSLILVICLLLEIFFS